MFATQEEFKEEEFKGKEFHIVLDSQGRLPLVKSKLYQLPPQSLLHIKLNSEAEVNRGNPQLFWNGPLFGETLQYNQALPATTIQMTSDLHEVKGEADQLGGYTYTLDLEYPGSFFFQLVYEKNGKIQISESQWFMVLPKVQVRANFGKRVLNIPSISLMTFHSKALGPFSNWLTILEGEANLGYNVFHFPPLQSYGFSDSLYSLKDHNDISDYYFTKIEGENGNGQQDLLDSQEKLIQLGKLIEQVHNELGCACIIDIVLNHASLDSVLVNQNLDSTYNTFNSPHLKVAFELDEALYQFSKDFSQKKIHECPFAPYVYKESEVDIIMNVINQRVLLPFKAEEYFLVNVQASKTRFSNVLAELKQLPAQELKEMKENRKDQVNTKDLYSLISATIKNQGIGRYVCEFDQKEAALLIQMKIGGSEADMARYFEKEVLIRYNNQQRKKIGQYLEDTRNGIRGDLVYKALQLGDHKIDGVRVKICRKQFYRAKVQGKDVGIACNGFVWGGTGVDNFALKGKWEYLRRKVVTWGDSAKLRYGDAPQDSPFLWKYMSNYVRSMGRIFDGFRLDNAHSTPVHLAKYLMNEARSQNPNLFVVAELFSNSQTIEAKMTAELGLTCLVRQLHHQKNPDQLASYLYFQGGCEQNPIHAPSLKYVNYGSQSIPLQPSKPHALIYDVTHDNPALVEQKPLQHSLPLMALNSFAISAIATTKGFDELIPKQLSVVKERKLYKRVKEAFESDSNNELVFAIDDTQHSYHRVRVASERTNWKPDIELHYESGLWSTSIPNSDERGFSYKFVINDSDWRVNPAAPTKRDQHGNQNNYYSFGGESSHFSNIRHARRITNKLHQILGNSSQQSAYLHHEKPDVLQIIRQSDLGEIFTIIARMGFNSGGMAPFLIKLPGLLHSIELVATLFFSEQQRQKYKGDEKYMKGYDANYSAYSNHEQFFKVSRSSSKEEECDEIQFTNVPPGFVSIFRVKSPYAETIYNLEEYLRKKTLDQEVFHNLDAGAINHIMYRCQGEEKESSRSKGRERGLFKFDDSQVDNQIKYAGIAPLVRLAKKFTKKQDLGNGLFQKIRQGDWLMNYIEERLAEYGPERHGALNELKNGFKLVRALPAKLKPKYFSEIIMRFDALLWIHLQKLSPVKEMLNSEFVQNLFKTVFQFIGDIPSAHFQQWRLSLSAGLPHFITGWARCWGRDTFIAFKGLILIPGLFKLAKELILAYASVSRHGLIPNLLDRGNSTRFNARDATWYWLKAVRDYVEMAPQGDTILKETVVKKFAHDDQFANQNDYVKISVGDLIQEIMQKHAEGIHFREWNAGGKIDWNMQDKGFNIDIDLDPQTGIIYGGNRYNCGTWMDKMGESEKAGNKGLPATPRSGAAVELIGIQASILQFLVEIDSSLFAYTGVTLKNKSFLSYKEWLKRLTDNFEKVFWAETQGFYKDTHGAGEVQDNQMRPNQCVALALAPSSLFQRDHAVLSLQILENELLEQGCMGMKTLSPNDPAYRGDYHNDNDTNDKNVARGWNYHNGPEWVWPLGYFLQAKLRYNLFSTKEQLKSYVMDILKPHAEHLRLDPWMGLPELTNSHGAECYHSCRTQAWSTATIIEALYELLKI